MLALAREVERLSNKKLIYIERIREDGDTYEVPPKSCTAWS
jgi:hypothetical protein